MPKPGQSSGGSPHRTPGESSLACILVFNMTDYWYVRLAPRDVLRIPCLDPLHAEAADGQEFEQ